jgi:hypothetical protein
MNFKAMYDDIEEEMIDAGISTKLDEPVWMNEEAVVVVEREVDGYGLKVTSTIDHPEMCIVCDEVGGNTSMMMDGSVGGEKVVCEVGCEGQSQASKNEKHFTVLGLTLLNGDPLMCVVIVACKTHDITI